MATVLVSIISDHLIPNFHLFKHLKDEVDEHLLVTTERMQDAGVTRNFVNYIEEEKYPIKTIVIDAWSFDGILKEFQIFFEKPADHTYIVNLTGGTKMVSLAVFDFFRELDARMYYVAIGSNSCTPFFPKHNPPENFNHSLSLVEYLGLYGYEIEYLNSSHKSVVFTKDLFNKVKQKNYNALEVYEIRAALVDKKCADKNDLIYFQGLWFEEYIYQLIKETLKLPDNQIAQGVKVRKFKQVGLNDNEFDVMFVNNNKLYAIECKSSIGKSKERNLNMEKFLYKLAATVHDFGLQVTPILAVLNSSENSKRITDRAEILKIKILDAQKFDNKQLLNFYLKVL
jgi:hypothetical protein